MTSFTAGSRVANAAATCVTSASTTGVAPALTVTGSVGARLAAVTGLAGLMTSEKAARISASFGETCEVKGAAAELLPLSAVSSTALEPRLEGCRESTTELDGREPEDCTGFLFRAGALPGPLLPLEGEASTLATASRSEAVGAGVSVPLPDGAWGGRCATAAKGPCCWPEV